jgi:hypothetical protein
MVGRTAFDEIEPDAGMTGVICLEQRHTDFVFQITDTSADR